MKRIFSLFCSAFAVGVFSFIGCGQAAPAFADSKAFTVAENTAEAPKAPAAANPEAGSAASPAPAEPAKAATAEAGADTEEGMEEAPLLSRFKAGMPLAAFQKEGKFTEKNGALAGTIEWEYVDWTVVAEAKGDVVASIALQTETDDQVLRAVLGELFGANLVPLSLDNGPTGIMFFEKVSSKELKLENCNEAMIDELGKFAEQDAGEILVIFSSEEVFNAFVKEYEGNGDEDALIASIGDKPLVALRMDKAENTIMLIIATVAQFNS